MTSTSTGPAGAGEGRTVDEDEAFFFFVEDSSAVVEDAGDCGAGLGLLALAEVFAPRARAWSKAAIKDSLSNKPAVDAPKLASSALSSRAVICDASGGPLRSSLPKPRRPRGMLLKVAEKGDTRNPVADPNASKQAMFLIMVVML